MQLKFFILPVKNLTAGESEMNAFLRSHRVLAVRKEFVSDGENSLWSYCVEYLESQIPTNGGGGGRPPKVDYKEVLKPEEFEVFSRLREWRNRQHAIGAPTFLSAHPKPKPRKADKNVRAPIKSKGIKNQPRKIRCPRAHHPISLSSMRSLWLKKPSPQRTHRTQREPALQ
jgi:hypothetical protein